MPNALSLFAGGGGLDLGFSAAGFNIVFSNDIDHHSCQTLRLNQNRREYYGSHEVEELSITELDSAEVLRKIEKTKEDIDFVIGGPPCQSFSVFGKRKGLEDPRGNLVFEYARIIDELKPKGFLFENVSGLKTIHDGQFYTGLLDTLSFGGAYKVSAFEYDVADYGIPQFRSRVIIIGSRTGVSVPKMESTHTSPHTLFNAHRPYRTVGNVLADMPEPGLTSGLYNHIGREHSQRIIDRYRALQFGERDSMTRINRLHPARPSYTIIVGSDKGGGKGHVHPYIPREVTPRESARLQTFPDWWEFYGNGRHVIRQVGNAVPPLFGALLANHVKRELFAIDNNLTYEGLVDALGLNFLQNAN
jgi:DNA (cytosine-5)-methyltransferase 1